MQWVASTLHTTSEHGVSSITTADAHTSAVSSRLNWRPPADLNGLVLFARKTKFCFCACAITFQLAFTADLIVTCLRVPRKCWMIVGTCSVCAPNGIKSRDLPNSLFMHCDGGVVAVGICGFLFELFVRPVSRTHHCVYSKLILSVRLYTDFVRLHFAPRNVPPNIALSKFVVIMALP